jgi:hypothetical protein
MLLLWLNRGLSGYSSTTNGAEFLLKPWKVQNPELHAHKMQSFLSKSLEGYKPYEEALGQLYDIDVRSVISSVCNMPRNTPF